MIPILVKLKLAGGWKGVAIEKWSDFVFEPDKLAQKPDKVFKSENDDFTALKKVEIDGRTISLVVKKTVRRKGIKAVADFLRAPKSLRNFYLAVLLKQKGIAVAEPVAALWSRNVNIYITEYIENSLNLYDIAFGKDREILTNFSARKAVIRQVAETVAKLNKANFRHRDPKAGNFIIYKDGGIYRVKLIDLDGIKQDSADRQENNIRTLSKLAETLIRFKTVNFTDLYRGFRYYCKAMGISEAEAKKLFSEIERTTVAMRLLTITSDSYKLKDIKKILIIKPSALGDIVQAMPAVCSLAESFPKAQIDWFVRPEYAPLVENHRCIHKTVIFERRRLGKWWYRPAAFSSLIRVVSQLRKEKYDIVFDFQGRFRSALFARLSGSKKRIGMYQTQEVTAPFYTDRIIQSDQSVHLVDYFLDMACAAGAKKGKVEFGLKPQPQAANQIQKMLTENQADKDNYAVFVPAATVEAKKWPIENFAALADKIYEKYKCSIVVIGVELEKAIAEKLKNLARSPIINLAGRTNIEQLIALFAGAKIVIGNDTGPSHIASALGVPMVLIFGLTNPSRVGPYGRSETVAAVDADKRSNEVESTNPAHNINNVTVGNVFDLICKQLS
jgi:heptosyltransferase-1